MCLDPDISCDADSLAYGHAVDWLVYICSFFIIKFYFVCLVSSMVFRNYFKVAIQSSYRSKLL